MEMWPEWDKVKVPVDDLHLGGTGKENPEPLLRSSLMAESFSLFPCSFSLTSVVRIILPSPAQDKTLTLEEVPREYMEVGRVWRADWEIKLS